MTDRGFAIAARPVLAAALGLWWVWALLTVPDDRLVLERLIPLPLLGTAVPAGGFLGATPFVLLVPVFLLRTRLTGWLGSIAGAALACVLVANTLKGVKLHSPVLCYSTAALAIGGAALAAAAMQSAGTSRRPSSRASNLSVAATPVLTAALELTVVVFLVPWALRGFLPGTLNVPVVGACLRSALYADLQGHVIEVATRQRNLRGVRLEGANLRRAVFRAVDLRDARLDHARMEWADVQGSDLSGAVLSGTSLSFANFRNTDLSRASLGSSECFATDLRGAVAKGANPHFLRYADARGIDLTGAEMIGAEHFGSDFRGAVLKNANLSSSFLIRVRFDDADLSGASLAQADLESVSFRGAKLDGADLRGARRIPLDSLARARSLKGASIDPAVLQELRRLNPALADK
jgi:uncharacterized protein YjbI with pentapeptide repeats